MRWLVFLFYSLKDVNTLGEMALIELSLIFRSKSINLKMSFVVGDNKIGEGKAIVTVLVWVEGGQAVLMHHTSVLQQDNIHLVRRGMKRYYISKLPIHFSNLIYVSSPITLIKLTVYSSIFLCLVVHSDFFLINPSELNPVIHSFHLSSFFPLGSYNVTLWLLVFAFLCEWILDIRIHCKSQFL